MTGPILWLGAALALLRISPLRRDSKSPPALAPGAVPSWEDGNISYTLTCQCYSRRVDTSECTSSAERVLVRGLLLQVQVQVQVGASWFVVSTFMVLSRGY